MRRNRWSAVALMPLVIAIGGCPAGSWDPVSDVPREPGFVPPDTIYRLVTTLPPKPWLNLDLAMDPKPEGFRFNLYLWSKHKSTDKAVKTIGLLQAQMFEVTRDAEGDINRELICDWTQDLKDVPQTKTEQAVGWGYQPQLHWGAEDVYGKEMEVIIWFEERNGRKVGARPLTMKIPPRKKNTTVPQGRSGR